MSVDHVAHNQAEITRLSELQALIKEELEGQRTRLQEATDFLQEAEDAKAQADLKREQDAYNELKGGYDTLKADYEALLKRDDEEGLEGDDLNRLFELENQYFELKETYEGVKAEVEQKERAANEKAFSKATANQEKTKIAQAEAQKAFDAAKAAAVEAQAAYDALVARKDTLAKQYETSQDKSILAEFRSVTN